MIAWKVVEVGSGLESLCGIAFLYIFPENDNTVNYDYSGFWGTHCLILDLQLEKAKLYYFVTLFSFIIFIFLLFCCCRCCLGFRGGGGASWSVPLVGSLFTNQGLKPKRLVGKVQSPNHWRTKEFSIFIFTQNIGVSRGLCRHQGKHTFFLK